MDVAGDNKGLDTPTPAAAPGRRCRLTVLFCDLSGSTALSGALEAEDYAQLLAALRAVYSSAVGRHGGQIVRIQGDGMLAVFGYPQAREGDGRRAVEAAVQAHRAVTALSVPGSAGRAVELRLHSGIHAGMVYVQQGDLMLGSLELLGMAPNIAGRLSDAAARDEILVSEETLGPDLNLFEIGPQRLVPVDSEGTRVPAVPVLGRGGEITSLQARTRRGLQPFIGREGELQRLEDSLGLALAGSPRRVAIAGPAGVGKTRLAEHFMTQARWKGCQVLKGHCVDGQGGQPLQPLRQMLQGALSLAPDAAPGPAQAALEAALSDLTLNNLPLSNLQQPALAPALLQVMGLASNDEAGARPLPADQLLSALSSWFRALAQRQPLLLFVDDWQWADDATRLALSSLGAAQADLPLLVLATTRSIDAGDAEMHDFTVVDLAPFSAAEATASIQTLLPQADPFVAAEIVRYSGGNALFIEELCHSAQHEAADRHRLRQQGGAEWLKVLVESRVARLADEPAELVRMAAVIGSVVPAWLLHALSGRSEDDPALLVLAEKDLLFPDGAGTLRFKHGITRDVIYESVGLHARRALHLRVAQALQQQAGQRPEQPHEALAHHCAAAGQPAEAAHHAELAGDRAAAISVLDSAKALYHLALAQLDLAEPATETPLRWLAIASKLGLVCVFDASRKDLPVFQRAVELARHQADHALLARAEYWQGYILYALGESQAAIAHGERALACAGPGDDPLAVQIRATLGQIKAAASDYAGGLSLLEEAVAIKRKHRRSARVAVGLAFSLVCLASVVGDRGDFERAHSCLDEAWALLNGETHQIGASIQGWRSAILTWQGRWAEARTTAQESARIAEQTRSLFQFCQGRVTAAYADWKLSADPGCITVADQATGWLEPRESGLFRSLNHGWLVDGWMAVGERDRARWHAARGLRRGRTGDLIGAAMAYRALALDAASAQDRAAAQRYLARARHVAERRDSAHEAACNRLCAAHMAHALDRPADLRQHADAALTAFEALHMTWFAERARELLRQA